MGSAVRTSKGARAQAPIVLIVGAPGSGKGTQAVRLTARLRAVYIGLGERFRSEIRHHSRLGGRIARYVETGRLVPSAVVHEEVAAALRRSRARIAERGAVLDGHPRTLRQARDLVRLVGSLGLPNPLVVVHLRGRHREFLRRLMKRGRADDTVAVALDRLSSYRQTIAPMCRFLRAHARVIAVNAVAPVDAVARTIREELRRPVDRLGLSFEGGGRERLAAAARRRPAV